MTGGRFRPVRDAPFCGAALAVALVVGLSPRGAAATRLAVLVVIALGASSALVGGRRRQRRPSGAWARSSARAAADWRSGPPTVVAAVATWVLVIGAVAAWDVVSFVAQRHDLPTLSHYVGFVTTSGWGRALLAAGWLAWGAWSALGFRRRTT